MKLRKIALLNLRYLFLILSMFPLLLYSNDSIKCYSPKQLIKDFNYLVKEIEEIHPNCYAYVLEPDLSNAEKDVLAQLTKDMTRQEFFKIIAPFFGLLKDGHSQIWVPYQDRNEKATKNILFFPLKLEFQKQGKCYITNNLSSDSTIIKGDELLSINNIPINNISDSLMLFFNGERNEFKIKVLENMYFELLLWYVYDFKNKFNIEYFNSKDNVVKKNTISGVTLNKIKTQTTNPDLVANEKLRFNLLKDSSIAILEINSFTGSCAEFVNFYKSCFGKIKENSIKNLIINVRNNGGGNSSYCDSLLNYLTDSSYCQFSALELKNIPRAKRQLKKEMPFLYRLIPFNMLFPGTKNNCYLIKQANKKPKNNQLRFHGNIYVLTSEFTFSSASNFACTIKDFHIGKIIGQETGGLASCYGPAIDFKLPNTKIDVEVSYQHVLRPAGFDDGRGVIPDISIQDCKWTDKEYYDFIYKLIQNNK
jgi:hypothetical protein